MKKEKLSLKSLKVKSFVTEAKEMNEETVKAGAKAIGTLPPKTTFDPTPCTFCYICPQDEVFF